MRSVFYNAKIYGEWMKQTYQFPTMCKRDNLIFMQKVHNSQV